MTFEDLRTVQGLAVTAGIVVASVVLYLVYKKLDSYAQSVTAPLADAIVGLTTPAVKTLSLVRFQNGTLMRMDDILAAGGTTEFSNGALYLTWQGRSYEISGRNQQGEYLASPL